MCRPTRTWIGPGASASVSRSRGGKSSGSGRKGEEEGVALRIDLDPAFRGARVPDEAAVLGERLGVCLVAE